MKVTYVGVISSPNSFVIIFTSLFSHIAILEFDVPISIANVAIYNQYFIYNLIL